jgi:hypothetical protein
MSEYQYYEFQAVDRCLTEGETDELRSFSSRADITTHSFINNYSWGSFFLKVMKIYGWKNISMVFSIMLIGEPIF